jgi:ABC-type tungstate transport system substrate-binding protein
MRHLRLLLLSIASTLLLALPAVVLAQDFVDAGAGLFASSISCICAIGWFVINIAILVWVYRDAQARGTNGAIWALLVFFTGIIGLIVYLLLGRNNPNPV